MSYDQDNTDSGTPPTKGRTRRRRRPAAGGIHKDGRQRDTHKDDSDRDGHKDDSDHDGRDTASNGGKRDGRDDDVRQRDTHKDDSDRDGHNGNSYPHPTDLPVHNSIRLCRAVSLNRWLCPDKPSSLSIFHALMFLNTVCKTSLRRYYQWTTTMSNTSSNSDGSHTLGKTTHSVSLYKQMVNNPSWQEQVKENVNGSLLLALPRKPTPNHTPSAKTLTALAALNTHST